MKVKLSNVELSPGSGYTYDEKTGAITFFAPIMSVKPRWWQFWKKRVESQKVYLTIVNGTEPGSKELIGEAV